MEDHPPHMIIWASITDSHVIGLYFSDGTVSGISYLDISRICVIPDPSDRGIIEKMYFQRVAAISRFPLTLLGFLDKAFPGRWIGRGCTSPSPLSKPPRISDLDNNKI
jgi:hypothetical protein